jgi:arginine/lysine/ornithine decarboxylase
MASISQCIAWASAEGDTAFAAYRQRTERLRRRLAALKHLYLYVPEGAFDWGKLVICAGDSGLSGAELSKRLRKDYALQVEMVSAEYVLAMTTVGDSDEGFERLAEALEQMDAEVPLNRIGHRTFGFSESLFSDGPALPERSMDIHEALEQPMEELPLAASAGRVAGDYLYLYPPGIPILVPGEVIQMQHIKQIQYDLDRGLEVHGGYIKEKGHVKVILYHG